MDGESLLKDVRKASSVYRRVIHAAPGVDLSTEIMREVGRQSSLQRSSDKVNRPSPPRSRNCDKDHVRAYVTLNQRPRARPVDEVHRPSSPRSRPHDEVRRSSPLRPRYVKVERQGQPGSHDFFEIPRNPGPVHYVKPELPSRPRPIRSSPISPRRYVKVQRPGSPGSYDFVELPDEDVVTSPPANKPQTMSSQNNAFRHVAKKPAHVKVTPKTSTASVKVTPQTSTAPVKVTSKTSTAPVKVTPKTSTAPVKVTPKTSTAPVQVTPKTSTAPVKVTPKTCNDGSKLGVKTIPQKKVPVKPAAKKIVLNPAPAPTSGTTNKDAVQGGSEQCSTSPTVVPSAGGSNRLDAVTSRVLDRELSNLMDYVMKDLPEPQNDADVDVLKRCKATALENAIRLFVSERLLNIHDTLYITLDFSHKPSSLLLRKLAARLGLSVDAIKPSLPNTDQYIAQIDNFAHLDRVLHNSPMSSGNLRVTILPFYKFTACPDGRNTVCQEEAMSTQPNKGANTKKAVRVLDTAQNKTIIKELVKTPKTLNKTEEKAGGVKIQPKVSENTTSDVKSQITAAEKKAGVNKTAAQTTLVNNSPKEETKRVLNKPYVTTEHVPKAENATQVKAKNVQTPKVTQMLHSRNVKGQTNTKLNVKVMKPVKTVEKPGTEQKTGQLVNTKKIQGKPKKEENDFDELDDKDILALICKRIVDECDSDDSNSTRIVIDECGSNDEMD